MIGDLLEQDIVYTGITRAKKRAVVMGTEASLKKALATSVERETGIRVVNTNKVQN